MVSLLSHKNSYSRVPHNAKLVNKVIDLKRAFDSVEKIGTSNRGAASKSVLFNYIGISILFYSNITSTYYHGYIGLSAYPVRTFMQLHGGVCKGWVFGSIFFFVILHSVSTYVNRTKI
jgi:hypothetical protein